MILAAFVWGFNLRHYDETSEQPVSMFHETWHIFQPSATCVFVRVWSSVVTTSSRQSLDPRRCEVRHAACWKPGAAKVFLSRSSNQLSKCIHRIRFRETVIRKIKLSCENFIGFHCLGQGKYEQNHFRSHFMNGKHEIKHLIWSNLDDSGWWNNDQQYDYRKRLPITTFPTSQNLRSVTLRWTNKSNETCSTWDMFVQPLVLPEEFSSFFELQWYIPSTIFKSWDGLFNGGTQLFIRGLGIVGRVSGGVRERNDC